MRVASAIRMECHRNDSASGLPQAEIERLAEPIARALTEPPPDEPRDDILAARHELPPADEDRVIAALLACHRD